MASAITHAVVGVALAQAGKREWRRHWSLWFLAVFCSVLPDIDVVGFRLGIHYAEVGTHKAEPTAKEMKAKMLEQIRKQPPAPPVLLEPGKLCNTNTKRTTRYHERY